MKPRVQQKLNQLRSYPFFESVGQPLPDSVTQIETWRMAAKECGKPRWDNSRLMASNALQSAIQNQFPKAGMWERMQEWNPVVGELRPSIDSLADSLLPKVPLSDELKLRVKQSFQWDFLAICLESEYSDIVEPIFYTKHLEPWFAAGRFPCGWDGPGFPSRWDGVIRHGQLFVF